MEALKSQIPWTKRLRRGIRARIVLAFLWLWSLLPLSAAAALGRFMGRLAWSLGGKYRRLTLNHLKLAFPELTAEEREKLGKECFQHLGWCAAEVVKGELLDSRLAEYVDFSPGSEQLIQDALAENKGVVVITGHVGNWELLARRIAAEYQPVRVVARDMNAPALTLAMDRYRRRGKINTLWRGKPRMGREMLATFKENGLLGLLIDQDTKVQNVWVPFFGHLAATPRAAGDFAVRAGAPVLAAFCSRRAEGGHRITVSRVSVDFIGDRERDSQAVTAACTAAIEAAIRKSPAEWVWMHERWKTPEPSQN